MRYLQPSEQCKNLYRFIRLVLGDKLSDREIARRWGIDEKNLRELKQGRRVVPKLSRLEGLAKTLKVNKYFVVEAASGVPAGHLFNLLSHPVLERDLCLVENTLRGNPPRQEVSQRSLLGLQSAALLAYQTLEPDKIFPCVSKELKKFGFETHIFMLDQNSDSAFIRHSSFHPRLLHMAEVLTGLSLSSFRFPINRVPAFLNLMQYKKPVFLPDATVLLGQILGENQLQYFIKKLKNIFKILEVVLTPIQIQGQVAGVLAAGQDGNLDEACLTEMNVFSKQLSRSLENAVLFQHVKQSENRLKTLFDNLPEGVFECDSQGNIIQLNSTGAQILGIKKTDDPIGKSIGSFQLLDPAEKTLYKHVKKTKKAAVKNIVGMASRQDGSPFLADITFRTQYGQKGTVERTEGIFRDITQQSN